MECRKPEDASASDEAASCTGTSGAMTPASKPTSSAELALDLAALHISRPAPSSPPMKKGQDSPSAATQPSGEVVAVREEGEESSGESNVVDAAVMVRAVLRSPVSLSVPGVLASAVQHAEAPVATPSAGAAEASVPAAREAAAAGADASAAAAPTTVDTAAEEAAAVCNSICEATS